MTDGVLLSKDELQELVDIRLAIDTFFKMLAANTDTSNGNEAAAVLQPIARWLGDFVDRVYERAG
jgi:hypothetical protein